ncbi:MAG TPA: BTAD domain-containing putative transcriptional regulator [Candidatus Dormibacteraeota bacterium]|nr:BTAD domain-containing putative transcriptional regulator [Candidatus Dormibacteraeota bacterium]
MLSRRRLLDWLEQHAAARVRLVAAAPGCGKSVLLREYMTGRDCAYLRIGRGEPAASARSRIAAALGIPPHVSSTHDDVVLALSVCQPALVLIDDADAGAPDWIDELNALVEEAPEHLQFVIAARSRSVIRSARLFVEGAVTRLPARALAFTAPELAELCDAHGVSYARKDLDHVISHTDGWPIIVSACVRLAAAEGSGLAHAFERWSADHRSVFADYVLQEAGRSGHLATFQRLLSTGTLADLADLETLERESVFVDFDGHHFVVFRAVRDVLSSTNTTSYPIAPLPVPPMAVCVLGEFEATVGGRRIKWLRRRDAQIFKYLLLKPDGRASRAELADAFWPGRERQLALQALRTSCCNIRHAVGEAVGSARTASYFVANGDVTVAKENVVVDAQSFSTHVAAAKTAAARGELRAVITHLEAARKTYRGSLIVDVPGAHYAAAAQEIDGTFATVESCLRALRDAPRRGSLPQAVAALLLDAETVRVPKRKNVANR